VGSREPEGWEAKNAGPGGGGAVGAIEEGEIKRHGEGRQVACEVKCISNVGEDGRGDEDIDVKAELV
jgi:hypothetical protein